MFQFLMSKHLALVHPILSFDLKKGKYVVGGHSQGGKIAAQMVYENPNVFKGLFLMGTSHPREIDLSSQNIPFLKLNGQSDGLASVKEVMDNQSKLPKDHIFVMIEGGNHSQFGYLGTLLMDNSAKISLEEQQKITVDNLVSFLFNLTTKKKYKRYITFAKQIVVKNIDYFNTS